jgi:hypothetical protein
MIFTTCIRVCYCAFLDSLAETSPHAHVFQREPEYGDNDNYIQEVSVTIG